MAEAPRRIEQSGLPTALMWHPLLGSDFEDRLVMTMFRSKSLPYYDPPTAHGHVITAMHDEEYTPCFMVLGVSTTNIREEGFPKQK